MNRKRMLAFAFAALITMPAFAQQTGTGAASGPIYTSRYFESQKIAPIAYKSVIIAELSRRLQVPGAIDAKFAESMAPFLSFTMPEFNRIFHARKVSGIGPDAVSDEAILEKWRPAIIGTAPKSEVYLDTQLSVSIVNRGQLVKTYDDSVGGLKGTFRLDRLAVQSNQEFANDDHATGIQLQPSDVTISIPMAKPDFQRQVYEAISSNRPLDKSYRVRLVLKMTGCERGKGQGSDWGTLVCTTELSGAQVFDSKDADAGKLIGAASARLGR